MSIEGTGKNLPHARASYAGQDTGSSSTWEGVKGWGRRNPRLSWITWAIVGLALVALVVWAIREGRQCARGVDEFLMGNSELPR